MSEASWKLDLLSLTSGPPWRGISTPTLKHAPFVYKVTRKPQRTLPLTFPQSAIFNTGQITSVSRIHLSYQRSVSFRYFPFIETNSLSITVLLYEAEISTMKCEDCISAVTNNYNYWDMFHMNLCNSLSL